MTDLLLRTFILCSAFILIAGCASTVRAANGEDAKINPKDSTSKRPRTLDESGRIAEIIKRIDLVENPTNTASKESDPFEERNLFADLIMRADLAFEAKGDGKTVDLIEPRHVRWMPIAELDRMLTNGSVRKEVAVVVIGQWYGRIFTEEEAKTTEQSAFWVAKGQTREGFASSVDEKLRKAGFKQVVFANTYNGMYSRMLVRQTPAEEKTQREKPSLNSSSTNSLAQTLNPAVTVSEASGLLCDSNRVAELISAINSTNTTFYAKFDFGESDVLGWLFRCADIAFKTEDGEFIQLARPEPLGRIPVSELDRVLTRRGLGKELAVVFIEQYWNHFVEAKESTSLNSIFVPDFTKKTPEKFAFEVDQKLRGAGFKQVIFGIKYHGLHHRMWAPTSYPK
jgi:hypothetical protein